MFTKHVFCFLNQCFPVIQCFSVIQCLPMKQLFQTRQRGKTSPNEQLQELLKPEQFIIKIWLRDLVHSSTRKTDISMRRYICCNSVFNYMWTHETCHEPISLKKISWHVWKKNKKHAIINLEKTWYKVILAARMFLGCNNPKEIFVVSQREAFKIYAKKFAKYIWNFNQFA